jgi:hypothetical protein
VGADGLREAVGEPGEVVAGRPDEHSRAGAGQGGRVFSRLLDRRPDGLEENPLARIHHLRLAWCDAEEPGVEGVDVVQETAADAGPVPAMQRGPLRWHRPQALTAGAQVPPEFVQIRRPGDAAAHADDRRASFPSVRAAGGPRRSRGRGERPREGRRHRGQGAAGVELDRVHPQAERLEQAAAQEGEFQGAQPGLSERPAVPEPAGEVSAQRPNLGLQERPDLFGCEAWARCRSGGGEACLPRFRFRGLEQAGDRLPVGLAVGRQGERIHQPEAVRDHVRGEPALELRSQAFRGAPLPGHAGRDETPGSREAVHGCGHGLGQAAALQGGLYLPQVDAIAANVDLMIQAAEELDRAVRPQARGIACAVHARAAVAGEGVGQEP